MWLGSAWVHGPWSAMAGGGWKCDIIACHTCHMMSVWESDLMQPVPSQTNSWSPSCQAKGAGCSSHEPCGTPMVWHKPPYLCLHNDPRSDTHIPISALKRHIPMFQPERNPWRILEDTWKRVVLFKGLVIPNQKQSCGRNTWSLETRLKLVYLSRWGNSRKHLKSEIHAVQPKIWR